MTTEYVLNPPNMECPAMRQLLAEIEATTVPYFLSKFALATCRTGSRIVCNPPVMNTDFDIVVLLAGVGDCELIEAEGYVYTEPTEADGYDIDDVVTEGTNEHWLRTYRKDDINLICLIDPTRFGRWQLATAIAKKLNLRNRPDRVELFALVKAHVEFVPMAQGKFPIFQG
jgi:hypothetical protein